jgi:hypothetical protein
LNALTRRIRQEATENGGEEWNLGLLVTPGLRGVRHLFGFAQQLPQKKAMDSNLRDGRTTAKWEEH